MSVSAQLDIDPAVLEANLKALRLVIPQSAERLAAAQKRESLEPTSARDGSKTFAWRDESGNMRWLGRSTMPKIRADALVDAFNPGLGNVLLVDIGQGSVVQNLLGKLAAHQAVMVIDESPWTVAAVLGLMDFAIEIEKRRLLLFTGSEPWDECGEWLLEHDGFLVPDRILAWPWFEPETVSDVSNRLAAMQTRIIQERLALQKTSTNEPAASATQHKRPAIAIVSNIPDPRIHHLARRLESGARQLEWRCRRFVLDDPAWVQTHAIERELTALDPTVTLFMDIVPEALHFTLPGGGRFIYWSRCEPLSEDWLKRVPREAMLGVAMESQRAEAIDFGHSASRVVNVPTAAVPASKRASLKRAGRVMVLGDFHDFSDKAVGLHLTSHCRLWKVAENLIRAGVDTYCHEDADEILATAEQKLEYRLQSEEVRRGIIQRIQHRLAPALVRMAYCTALVEAGLAFDLFGCGWQHHSELKRQCYGPWPETTYPADDFAAYGLIITLDTTGIVDFRFLDALAAGVAGCIRRHPLDETQDGIAAILDPDKHIRRFVSRKDLVDCVSKYLSGPEAFLQQAAQTAEHVNAAHTWRHRIEQIVRVCTPT